MKTQPTKLDFRQSLVLVTLLASALYAQVARAAEINLSGGWLGTNGRLEKSEFSDLLTVASRDPESAQLIADVTKKMGFTNPSELYDLMRICESGENAGEYGHLATHEEKHITHPKLGYIDAPFVPPSADELHSIATDNRGLARTEHFVFKPEICMIPSLSVGEAAVTLAHELIHLLGYIPFSQKDILTYADKADYARSRVEAPGGELDAHVGHTHLAQTLGIADGHGHYARFLAADGTIANREGMIEAILKDGGYGDRLEAEYVNHLRAELATVNGHLSGTPPGGNPIYLRNVAGLRKDETELQALIDQHPSNEGDLKAQLEDVRLRREQQETYVKNQILYSKELIDRKQALVTALTSATKPGG
ncbi:MAG: hypothetical protein AAB425_10190 [Bdellovibrionota bacterium]